MARRPTPRSVSPSSAGGKALTRMRRRDFFRTPYGRGIWVSVWADTAVNWDLVDDLIERAYRQVALKRMLAALDVEQ